ncbi:MAG: hypothetical protein ONB25_02310 [candidate division KSB1 bacterium]|nr:hypothetical protein [candidate division KSB1 bacterium]
MPKRVVPWVILLAALLLGACEDRKRLNPLDPLNPSTKGRPTGVAVVSEGHEVTLRWDEVDVEGLVGYRVFRRVAPESMVAPVALAPSATYRDVDRPYGVRHEYCTSVVTADYETPCSEAVSIVPGPTYCWVASAYEGTVVRLTHDRRHELLRYSGMAYPWIVEPDPVTGSVWVVDAIYGTVTEISTSGSERVRLGWLRQPNDIALDHRRRFLWVLEQSKTDSAVVHKFATDGNLVLSSEGFVRPSRLAVDINTGACFVADLGARKVMRVSANGRVSEAAVELVAPTGLACDCYHGNLWVADATQVLVISLRSGAVAHAEGPFLRAYTLAANDSTGECWVVDLGSPHGQAQVVRLRPDGTRVASYGPFVQPYGVAVNIYDASCIVADTGADRLVEISADGLTTELPVRVVRPWDVVIENHFPLH